MGGGRAMDASTPNAAPATPPVTAGDTDAADKPAGPTQQHGWSGQPQRPARRRRDDAQHDDASAECTLLGVWGTAEACAFCGKQDWELRDAPARDKLKCCPCRSVHYCGAECQKNDWNLHRLVCDFRGKRPGRHGFDEHAHSASQQARKILTESEEQLEAKVKEVESEVGGAATEAEKAYIQATLKQDGWLVRESQWIQKVREMMLARNSTRLNYDDAVDKAWGDFATAASADGTNGDSIWQSDGVQSKQLNVRTWRRREEVWSRKVASELLSCRLQILQERRTGLLTCRRTLSARRLQQKQAEAAAAAPPAPGGGAGAAADAAIAAALATATAAAAALAAIDMTMTPVAIGGRRQAEVLLNSPDEWRDGLGITFQVSKENSGQECILCAQVRSGSPAERSGLRHPFVIYGVDGVAVADMAGLISTVEAARARRSMRLSFTIGPCGLARAAETPPRRRSADTGTDASAASSGAGPGADAGADSNPVWRRALEERKRLAAASAIRSTADGPADAVRPATAAGAGDGVPVTAVVISAAPPTTTAAAPPPASPPAAAAPPPPPPPPPPATAAPTRLSRPLSPPQHVASSQFSHYVCVDFEATCERGNAHYANEIIEFPAVALCVRTLRIVSEFHLNVRPEIKPKLTPFCTQLTGITQTQVDASPPLHAVLRRFDSWLREVELIDADGRPSFCLVTDGPCDIRDFFWKRSVREQRKIKPAGVPEYWRRWIDIREFFQSATGHQPTNTRGRFDNSTVLHAMLEHLGLQFEGRPHSGICDARNVARVLRTLQLRGHSPSITGRYDGGER